MALGWLISCALEFLQVSCSLTHANARTTWAQMSGGCRGRCDHCQHVNADAKTEAEDHAGKLCDMARCEMSEKDMELLDEVCEVRGIGLAPAPKAAPTAPAPRAPRSRASPPVPTELSRASSASAAARPDPATRPPPRTPPRRPSPRRRTPTPSRRSRSPARDGQQTEALIARISELTSVVSQLVAERDQARAASSTYRSRRSRSDSRDSRRRGRSRSPRESRFGEAPWRREVSYRRPRTPTETTSKEPVTSSSTTTPSETDERGISDGWLAKSFGLACKGG